MKEQMKMMKMCQGGRQHGISEATIICVLTENSEQTLCMIPS